jgi:hypothetical protein
MPEAFASFHNKWRALNPNWSVKIWSDEDMLALVHKYYPKWRHIFNRVTTPMVVKADIFRYMLMETFGGVYADMDMEPLRPLDFLLELLGRPACVLGQEPLEHAAVLEGKEHFICNALLISKPQHRIWNVLLEKIYEEMTEGWMQYHPNPNPVSLTGPGRLTKVVEEEGIGSSSSLCSTCSIVKPDVFYPASDTSAQLHGKCLSLFRNAWNRKQRVSRAAVKACKKVSEKEGSLKAKKEVVEDQSPLQQSGGSTSINFYPPHAWAVHHWMHTWISKHSKKFKSHVV